ncbi:hypothetical protein POM88_030085 [Heracleum sosnowskyi]|uniref:Uncharacterized protein n=1 Tax=Heracleum sosnowskyi TaxID=360622 RepID=A0AAD8MIB6_9APIA|nr:hypothetical protein POM88_030085 [Heracleum sosnowskyi]
MLQETNGKTSSILFSVSNGIACTLFMIEQCIKYLGTQERKHYEYVVVEGKIVHQQTGNFLNTNKGLPGAKWIFVMSTWKRLYAGEKKRGGFHHSSFLVGGATLAAGRLVVNNGTLKSISAYSGHYRPTDERLDSFLSFLKDNRVKLDEVENQAAEAELETEKAYKQIDKLKRKHERDISATLERRV